MKQRVTDAALVIMLVVMHSLIISNIYAQQEFSIETTNMQIYRDGLVSIKQIANVEELYPQITIPLFSPTIENIIVLDQNQKIVDYELVDQNLTIFSLGATQISIEYETFSLTNKIAEVWSINIENLYEVSVSLPKNSTVIYLNQMPDAIDTQENIITVTLPPNQWEISYLLSPSSSGNSDNGNTDQNLFQLEYFIVIFIVLILLIIIIFFVRKTRKPNVKKIFKKYPQLSKEDKEVIQFLGENEGRAFEAEIRVRFPDLPRTSLWRLARRLERMEIVEIKKIGLENQVKLK